MQDNSKINFYKILDIIEFSGNKEELYNKIVGLIYFNSLVDLIETLPEDKKEEAGKAILGTKDQEQADNVKKYFSEEQITDALKKSSEKIFSEYYNSIKTTLSESQLTQLNNYWSSVVPTT